MKAYKEIELDYTPENVKKVLRWGMDPKSSPYTHQAIAGWCERFWNKYCDEDAPEEIDMVMPILADIETQWDIYLADYTNKHPDALDQIPSMPIQWFEEWLGQLEA